MLFKHLLVVHDVEGVEYVESFILRHDECIFEEIVEWCLGSEVVVTVGCVDLLVLISVQYVGW